MYRVLHELHGRGDILLPMPTLDGKSDYHPIVDRRHAELMHIDPSIFTATPIADRIKGRFGASCAADVFALGCIANQIFFRDPLYSELTYAEHANDHGSESLSALGKHAVIIAQILRGDKARPPINWTLRNGVRRTRMLDVLLSCCAINADKRPTIRLVKTVVNATAHNMCVPFLN